MGKRNLGEFNKGKNMNQYEHNLGALKELLDKYTIADLKSMIYDIPVKESGGCCYPAIQLLISLMELLGKVIKHDIKEFAAFEYVLYQLGEDYKNPELAKNLYEMFRHGIAHTALAKGGFSINKIGDRRAHLFKSGKHIDVRVMFEDFLIYYNKIFNEILPEKKLENYYEGNLKRVFSGQNFPWLDLGTPSLFSKDAYTTTTSGTATSGASGSRGPSDTFTP